MTGVQVYLSGVFNDSSNRHHRLHMQGERAKAPDTVPRTVAIDTSSTISTTAAPLRRFCALEGAGAGRMRKGSEGDPRCARATVQARSREEACTTPPPRPRPRICTQQKRSLRPLLAMQARQRLAKFGKAEHGLLPFVGPDRTGPCPFTNNPPTAQ